MKCERCAFFSDCKGLGKELRVRGDYDESDEARSEERKGEW